MEAVHVRKEIDVTDTERKIFDRLLSTLRHFQLHSELRVAGGWVRDKLLGKDCYDIDIAIGNMLGSEIVDRVREYLSSTGEEAKGVAVIARMRVFDRWIDFVNLRCEDYCENSRIPTMEFGKAMEDAYRRDLTVNSLFYNINSSTIEDFTERDAQPTEICRETEYLDAPLESKLRVATGLENVWDVKPLVNGKEIMQVLQLKYGGPLVREWQQKLIAWQLAHPAGTTEECIDWMKEMHSKRIKV